MIHDFIGVMKECPDATLENCLTYPKDPNRMTLAEILVDELGLSTSKGRPTGRDEKGIPFEFELKETDEDRELKFTCEILGRSGKPDGEETSPITEMPRYARKKNDEYFIHRGYVPVHLDKNCLIPRVQKPLNSENVLVDVVSRASNVPTAETFDEWAEKQIKESAKAHAKGREAWLEFCSGISGTFNCITTMIDFKRGEPTKVVSKRKGTKGYD